ncbi:hypothetical protein U9M48_025256 [Paspalum notatum var. saurae]|uniref:F-box domain-containing protein n=1 Tax=Paspalum notatum var. saurae TaxID=547442 RepID=A0AAQ3TNF3_PASNO
MSKRPRHGGQPAPLLPDDVIVEHILTRVPAAAAVRFRAVCRAWRAVLTSDHFVQAHRAARAAGRPPEINGSSSTSPPSARELVTVSNLRARDLVLSGPCRGLTLLFQPGENEYHVCNLSTGEHVSLPLCEWPHRAVPYGPYVLSSAGLCFDPAAGEHTVVRLFEDWGKKQRCEVYGLRSGGGWRPFAAAGAVPPHVGKGLDGRPPVVLDGRFYWHINTLRNFPGEADRFATPEPILSLSVVGTPRFGWVPPPGERARHSFHLAELDGRLCAAVDRRLPVHQQYELWVLLPAAAAAAADDGGSSPSPSPRSLRCRISLASLPRPVRDGMSRGIRLLPIGSVGGGKQILLATSCHEVFAYDPEGNNVDRVFSVRDFLADAPREPELLLNIAMHEEWVTGVRHRPGAAGEEGNLKMKLGGSTVAARRGGPAEAEPRRDGVPTSSTAHHKLLMNPCNCHPPQM